MEAVQIKMALARVKFHVKVLWRGFCRTVYGATVAGIIAIAIHCFISVTNETGWIAVFHFIVAFATMDFALANMYFIGRRKKGGAKHG